MNNTSDKAVYKLSLYAGRQGTVEGMFIAKKKHIELLINHQITVHFGEVLGKYSDIYCPVDEESIIFVSDNPSVIDIIEKHDLQTGVNPFEYNAMDEEREDFEGLTILEIVEILESESNVIT